MKKHWFLVVGENGNQRASSYFAKDSMNISKSEIDERFKNHLSEMMGG